MTTPTPGDNELKENNVNNLSVRLPELPFPDHVDAFGDNSYTADQMRAYAIAALSALPVPPGYTTDKDGSIVPGSVYDGDERYDTLPAAGEKWEADGIKEALQLGRLKGHEVFYTTPQPSAAECNCNPKGWRKSVAHGVPAYSLCECVVPPPDAAVGAQGDGLRQVISASLYELSLVTEGREHDEAVEHIVRRLAAPAARKGVDTVARKQASHYADDTYGPADLAAIWNACCEAHEQAALTPQPERPASGERSLRDIGDENAAMATGCRPRCLDEPDTAAPAAGKCVDALAALLAHDFAEDCQECAIGQSEAWQRARALLPALTRQPVAGDGMAFEISEPVRLLMCVLEDNHMYGKVTPEVIAEVRHYVYSSAPAATPTDGGEG